MNVSRNGVKPFLQFFYMNGWLNHLNIIKLETFYISEEYYGSKEWTTDYNGNPHKSL